MTEQSDLQQRGIVGVFSRAAAMYDRIGPRFFDYFGRRLIAHAQLAPGNAVLDVAAGRGAILFPAAEKVGTNGQVIGIDLADGMVQETSVDIQRAGLKHVSMRQMDAERLDFADASFDHVLCGFAVFFFPEPQRALGEFLRVLKPGGRVLLSAWAKDDPYSTWLIREFRAALPPQTPPAGRPPAMLPFDTPERLLAALQQSGFADIQVSSEDQEFVYADEDEWWASMWSHGMRGYLERLEPAELESVKAKLLHALQVFKHLDGIHSRMQALIAVGRKPDN
jgi:ubiquinone/menaquinone biosynthesis C-methylase UbiE